MFILPYIISTLTSNENSTCEIVTSRCGAWEPKKGKTPYFGNLQKEFLDHHFKGRYIIRSAPNYITGSIVNLANPIGRGRFFMTPEIKSDITYIGDSDIIVVDKNVAEYHSRFMKRFILPYSNVIRPCKTRISGLHAVSPLYWDTMTKEKLKETWDILAKERYMNDEVALMKLIKTAGFDNMCPVQGSSKETLRPIHGLHLSFSGGMDTPRTISRLKNQRKKHHRLLQKKDEPIEHGWGLGSYSKRIVHGLEELFETEIWKDGFKIMDPKYQEALNFIRKPFPKK